MTKKKKQVAKQDNNQLSGFLAGYLFLGGLLLGNVAGAGVMLLMAPQSGKKTRKQIQRKGWAMKKKTIKTVKHKAEQAQDKAHQVTTSIQDAIDDQKDRWEPVITAGKTAVNND